MRESRCRPRCRSRSSSAHAEGLVCLSGCAREGAVAGPLGARRPGAGGRLAGGCCRRSARTASGSSCSGRSGATTARATAGSRRSPSGSGSHASRPATSTPTSARGSRLQDALVAIRLGATLDQTEGQRRGNRAARRHGSPSDRCARALPRPSRGGGGDGAPGRAAALRPHQRPRLQLSRRRGPDADRRLAELCRARLARALRRARRSTPRPRRRLDEELALIRELRLSGFFLLHHDMLELAREVARRGARAGLGAAAAAARPRPRLERQLDRLLPDRALAHRPGEERALPGALPERGADAMPDIDLDFPRDIREKLIPRVHERYGPERSALVARLRDLPGARCDPRPRQGAGAAAPARSSGSRARGRRLRGEPGRVGADRGGAAAGCGRARRAGRRWPSCCRRSRGCPAHISQHPGGMVISTEPLIELCPVQPAAMEGRQIVQWDKDSCADAGFLKIDLLGLGMLSASSAAWTRSRASRGERIDLSRVPLDDAQVCGDDPAGRDDRRLPDREPRADADAAAHAAAEPRRPDGAGGAGAAGADPGRRRAPLYRAAQAAAARTPTTRCPTSTRRSSRCCRTRSA